MNEIKKITVEELKNIKMILSRKNGVLVEKHIIFFDEKKEIIFSYEDVLFDLENSWSLETWTMEEIEDYYFKTLKEEKKELIVKDLIEKSKYAYFYNYFKPNLIQWEKGIRARETDEELLEIVK